MKMMKRLMLTVLLASVLPAQAATQSFNVTGQFDSGYFVGASYQGGFSFDDASLSSMGTEFLNLASLSFNLLGSTYTLATPALQNAQAVFQNGVFTGVEWAFDTPVSGGTGMLGFSLVAGSTGVSDAFVAYDTTLGTSGTGTTVYAPVPEPEQCALLLAGVAVMTLRRRSK